MLKKLISRKPKKAQSTLATLDKLRETLENMEKKEDVLRKKISREVEKAKDLAKLKNKNAAIQCLKKKKLYESQIEQLGNCQLKVHDQMIAMENANATTETVDALRRGASAVKSINHSLKIDEIDKTMEQLGEQSENMKQIQEALAVHSFAADDFDEDELEAELEELEEMDEQLPQPPQTIPAPPIVSAQELPAREVDDLAVRQAAMAL
ncbi:unnamed protein product [Spirodela intermedia]|uniref:Uncharacterized protein n=1 Tax=Spirodela intermedia TaxID=51605 RepID=A0A7I8IAD7_SPIIN|nr:unnamed protein product [Spirodela intermedia]CAA6654550.1 unnamed protein product [Spirodela intermedia]